MQQDHSINSTTHSGVTNSSKNEDELRELVQHAVQDVSLYFFRKEGKLQKSISSMLPFV